MSPSSSIIASVLIADKSEWAIWFPIWLQYRARTIVTTILVDCRATGNFINPTLVQRLLPYCPIQPLQAFNINGTANKQGHITTATKVHCTATTFEEDLTLMIMGLGHAQIVLGMPWLTKNNPHIDWVKKTISFDEEHIRKTTLSTKLTITAKKNEVVLPPQYSDYADVFSERMFDILPPHWDFDHTIELKETFTLKVIKLYPLNPQELEACKEFIKENLKMGQIQQSKSPQASPFFFVKKKDGKLCPVQDYHYLNEHTVTFSSLITLKPQNSLLVSHWLIFTYSSLRHLVSHWLIFAYSSLRHPVSHWLIFADSLLHFVLYKPDVPTLYSLS